MHYRVKSLCGLLGISRQGFYKHQETDSEQDILVSSIVLYCRYLRQEDHLPQAGARELYELSRQYFSSKFTIGRDRFYEVLRANSFMLRRRRNRVRTTNSRHPYLIYPDLLNTFPKLTPDRNGVLMVADITYVHCAQGFAYLALLTDAYSRCIVGHCLYPTLETKGPLIALSRALKFYKECNIDIGGVIHHSDRGIQYACAEYVKSLRDNQIRISMTQSGDPLHNALAERMNNTLKNGWMFNQEKQDFKQVEQAIGQAVIMYNTARPHQALNMKTPMEMFSGKEDNPLVKGCFI